MRKSLSTLIILAFLFNTMSPMTAGAQELVLPKPGVRVGLSSEFTPAHLKGITIHQDNALMFDFIIQRGTENLSDQQKQEEYKKLIKYFLASLAVPDENQWVNLSPYEKNRIIKDDFGKTEMGRDLLAQDYILKQLTASLIYPEDNLGKKFWDKVYAQAQQQYGTTNIPVNTFNKVWIVPDDALVYEKGNTAYVVKNHLKVMLEEDYLALSKHEGIADDPQQGKGANKIGSQVVREIVLPALEQEVNEGKNFAPLRQVYSGMILAAWYKRVLKESLLGKIYADKAKVKGVDQDPKNNEAIYQRYLQAYKKGVFNYIKEDVDKLTNETIPRKYFSGGTTQEYDKEGSPGYLKETKDPQIGDLAMNSDASTDGGQDNVRVRAAELSEASSPVGEGIQTPSTDNGEIDSGLSLPLVTDPEVLRLSKLAALEVPYISGKTYTLQNSPRMQLSNLGVDRPGLIPQIMAAFVNLPGAEADAGAASRISGLDRLPGFTSQHTSLMLIALAALALKGNANAAANIRNVFKENDLSDDEIRTLSKAVEQGNNNASFALGMMLLNNGPAIITRLDEIKLEAIVKVLTENGLKGDGKWEAEALDQLVMYSIDYPNVQLNAFQALERLSENGSEEAAHYFVQGADNFVDHSNKARLISASQKSISKIVWMFRKSVADNPNVKERMAKIERFEKRIAPLIFKLASQAEQDGSDLTGILENYGNWQEFNIFRPLVWPELVREHILENRLANKLNQPLPSSSQGIAIVIYPKSDHNSAFLKSEPIKQLIDRGYSVMYYEVASPVEMEQAIKDATKDGETPASFMLIGGHGTPDSIQFGNIGGEDAFLASDHETLAPGALRRFFKPDAKGLLESCSSGGITTKEVNMVQAFANANGINVYGPDKNTSLTRINFDSLEASEFMNASTVTASPIKTEDANLSKDLGGIDLNAANLNLQIKRDGKGVPLPISDQNLENIRIDGLVPIIIEIKPVIAPQVMSKLQVSQVQS